MPVNSTATGANRALKAISLIRILVGWVFLSEGIQKFLFPDSLGVGRFVKIGIPWPQVMAPFVGLVQIVCGSLLLLGEIRTDVSMVLGLIFLLLVGAGAWFLDAQLAVRRGASRG